MANQRKAVVWITGAGGLLGNYLLRTAAEAASLVNGGAEEERHSERSSRSMIGLTRAMLDLTDLAAVRERFDREQPELIIHCAALSRSTVCEEDPPLAHKINVETTKLLSDLAANGSFIFLSSDLVFDGRKGWYDEASAVSPLTVYARTKVEAEQIVLQNSRHTVVRTSLNGGTSPAGNRAFNEELRRAWQAGKPARLFVDEFRCPIPAIETARAIWELAEKRASGLFHVAGRERLSRWQIGELLAARWPNLHPKLERASIRDYSGPPRSADTSLNCAKAANLLGRALPGLTEWLKNHAQDF